MPIILVYEDGLTKTVKSSTLTKEKVVLKCYTCEKEYKASLTFHLSDNHNNHKILSSCPFCRNQMIIHEVIEKEVKAYE